MSASADQVARAKALLAVCEGETYQQAASLAGRKSNAAVSPLVSHFNKEGLSALETKHGGGPTIEYTQAEKERIVREFQRTPDRVDDGTATWSLVTLQRSLRKADEAGPYSTLPYPAHNWQPQGEPSVTRTNT